MGHLIAAAGAVEASVCALAIRDGVLPVNANLPSSIQTATQRSCAMRRAERVRSALSNSLGFGGSNSCVVAFRPPARSRRPAVGGV